MAVEYLSAQTGMRSAVPLAFVVAAVAGAVDSQRALGTPVVPDLGHAAAHYIAASRTWVDGRNCSAPVLVVASYPAVELAFRLLGDEPLGVFGPEPAAESLHEAIVPKESRRRELPVHVLVALAVGSSSHIVLGIEQC